MTTVEWTNDEIETLEYLGFVLNFKGFFTKDDLTLTKRLDQEFNELYYSAYHKTNGLISNVPAYRIDDPFESFSNEIRSMLIDADINDLNGLIEWLNEINTEIGLSIVDKQDGTSDINFSNKIITVANDNVEKTVLYLTINLLIKNLYGTINT